MTNDGASSRGAGFRPGDALWAVIAATLVTLPTAPAGAQEQRLGLISGTWEACVAATTSLRQRAEAGSEDPDFARYLQHRLTVELDRCASRTDTPAAVYAEVIRRYQQLDMPVRALNLARAGLERYGATPMLQLPLAQILFARGERDAAEKVLLEILESEPRNAAAHRLLATHFYDRGDLVRAISHLRVVADDNPEEFEINAALGDACLAADDLQCASTALQRALDSEPNDTLLAVKVGDLHYRRGDFPLALGAYDLARVDEKTRAAAELGRGRTLAQLELFESSAAAFWTASDMQPEAPEPAVEGSRVLRRLGRGLAGLQLTTRALAKGATETALYVERAVASVSVGRGDVVVEQHSSIPQTVRQDDRYLAALGDAQMTTLGPQRALESYHRAWDRRPHASYAVRRSRALRRMGRLGDARELLLELDPKAGGVAAERETATLALARDLVSNGKHREAARILDQEMSAQPNADALRVARFVIRATAKESSEPPTSETSDDRPWRRAAAWAALVQNQPAVALEQLETPKSNEDRLLAAEALFRLDRFSEAAAQLEKVPGQASEERRRRVLLNEAGSLLDTGEFVRADTVLEKPLFARGDAASAGAWHARAVAVSRVAQGNAELPTLSPNRDHAQLDRALLASRTPPSELSSKQIASLGTEHPVLVSLANRLYAEQGVAVWKSGSGTQARRILRRIDETAHGADWPVALRLNLAVARAGNAAELQETLAPFVAEGMPEALFNLARSRELAAGRGDVALPTLEKLLQTAPSHSLAAAVRELTNLKKALYR